MKRFLFLILLCLPSLSFAALTLNISTNKLSLGDTFTLTLTSDDVQNAAQPDLSHLALDFSILSTEHRVNYTIINGQSTAKNEWIFILLPKRTGLIPLPTLSVGNQKTTSNISVEVTEASSQPTTQPQDSTQDVFFNIEVSPKDPYLHEQVRYTVKVFNRRQLLNVDYTPPQAKNTLIIPLGQTKQYQTTVNGKLFAVEELRYALFPNKSGSLTLTPPHLKGLIYDTLPEPLHISGAPVTLTVKKAPSGNHAFLPAQSLTLTEDFDQTTQTLSQGTTLIRTLTLKATGVPAALLPLPTVKGKGFSVYPSRPELHHDASDAGLVGTVTVRLTYLFDHAGHITLPEIQLPWFNTTTHHAEEAHLPAHAFTITPTAAQPQSQTMPPAAPPSESTPRPWGLISLFILFCIVISYFTLYKKPRVKPKAYSHAALKKACLHNDPKAAQHAILNWANHHWRHEVFLNSAQIIKKIEDKPLHHELNKLAKVLYQKDPSTKWQGKPLWEALQGYLKQKKQARPTKKSTLPNLHP